MAKRKVLWFLSILYVVESLFAGDICTGHDSDMGRPAYCTLLSTCKPLRAEIERAGTPMPISIRRKLQALTCGFQSKEPLVCCVGDDDDETSDRTTEYSNKENENDDFNNNKNGDRNDDESTPVDVQSHRNLKLLPRECGFIESDRIFGGNKTRLYEMPWMALLVYDSGRGTSLSCGGTIINERYVLTAAHCVSFLPGKLTLSGVRLGEYDTRHDPDCERLEGVMQCAPNVWDVKIEKVIAHPGYNPKTLFDDIALLRLSTVADFGLDNMKPICLPSTPALQRQALVGKPGVVAGWGAAEDGLQSHVLLSVSLPIVSNDICQKSYKGSAQLYPKQLCAGGKQEEDACAGDSGGPLMFPGKTPGGVRYVQRGIVSFGSRKCGIGEFPGVYTHIAFYMDWILDNMRP